jgi:6-phosphofructokinase 1
MLRLNQADFDDPHELAKLAATIGVSIDKFRELFGYVIENDLLYKNIKDGKFSITTAAESNAAYKIIPPGEDPESDYENA